MKHALEFEKNWTVTWIATTQAAFNICITLQDPKTGHKYVDNVCRQNTEIGVATHGTAVISNARLELDITANGQYQIQWRVAPLYAATKDDGVLMAKGYMLVGEDSTDNDFNDVYFSIMGWKSTG